MMRCHVQFFVACLLATLAGCSWDSALYDEFVSSNNSIVSCAGECVNAKASNLSQAECKAEGLAWKEGRCSGLSAEVSSDDVKDKLDCSAHGGKWVEAKCEATTAFGCYILNGEWRAFDFKVLDIGEGRYIRELDSGYFCGRYEEVLQASDARGCKDSEIKKFKNAQENHICPSSAQNCTYFPPTNKLEESDEVETVIAMCSSCAEGMAVCEDNNKYQCVDLNSNANHCGACGIKCESTETSIKRCIDGVCKVDKCDPPKEFCKETRICIDPTDAKTCGMTCEKEGEVCQFGNTCVFDGNHYKCDCESGIHLEDKNNSCVNPSSNDTCGASTQNPDGTTCGIGQSCQRGEDGKYACKCTNPNELTCINAEGQPYCVDTYSNTYCGATSCDKLDEAGCSASQQCQQGKCVCRPEFVNCNGTCIDPYQNAQHCGAVGSCTMDEPTSENYKGDVCDSSKVCSRGKCICNKDAGYFEYHQDNKLNCVLPSDKLYCGITSDDNKNNEMDECLNHEECVLKGDKYKCECEKGYTLCGGECVDLKRDSEHCSSTGKCEDAENCNESGKVCVAGKCDTSCPPSQALCDGRCVDKEEFHVNDDCTGCDASHCYLGDSNKAFNYKYCKETPEGQSKNNALGSGEFCGETCEKARSCGKNQVCTSNFTCDCPAGYIECSDENGAYCADLTSDIENCGKCGNTCIDKFVNVKGLTCTNGECGFTECINKDYAVGEKTCNDNRNAGCLINLTNNENFCGNCETKCGEHLICKDSKCCYADMMISFEKIKSCCTQNANTWQLYADLGFLGEIDFDIYICLPEKPSIGHWKKVN